MQQTPSPTPKFENPYVLVGRRIQRLITAPSGQKIQAVTISKQEDECDEAWQQVLQEIEETSGVRIDRLESGVVRIGWREYCDA